MNPTLKKTIVLYILDNLTEFQLTINTYAHFHEYMYDKEWGYLIGGEEVSEFIRDACKLLCK